MNADDTDLAKGGMDGVQNGEYGMANGVAYEYLCIGCSVEGVASKIISNAPKEKIFVAHWNP